jgi:hypothetical protein
VLVFYALITLAAVLNVVLMAADGPSRLLLPAIVVGVLWLLFVSVWAPRAFRAWRSGG